MATATVRQILRGHARYVADVAFSSSGELLVSVSSDTTIKFWDPANGRLLRTLEGPEGHSQGVIAVSFSPNDKQLATASYDKTLKLWDVSAGTILKTLPFNPRYIDAVAFSAPDGSWLACALDNYLIRLLNIRTGAAIQIGRAHEGPILAVAMSSNNKQLASASTDKTITVWDSFSGQALHSLKVDGWIQALLFSSDQTVLHTDKGPFCITFSPGGAAILRIDPACAMRVREQWVSRGDQNMLSLPPEYRPTSTAIRGDVVVLGHGSGLVSVLEFNF
jgi:WD40 repeat protein